MFLAPLSEFFGRSPVYISTWFVLVVLHIGLALAPNIGTIIVIRFLAGFFGSAPLTNSGGTISDLWRRDESGFPMAIYGLSSTGGPPLALVISGYLAQNLGWRWLFWVQMIVIGFFWLIMAVTLPETRHTIVLDKKTGRVRKQMKKEGLGGAEHVRDANSDEKKGLHTLFAITLTRPVRFLITEPITFCAAIYNGFIYGLVGPTFSAQPLYRNFTHSWLGVPFQRGLSLGLWTYRTWLFDRTMGPYISWTTHRIHCRHPSTSSSRKSLPPPRGPKRRQRCA